MCDRQITDEMFELALQTFCLDIEMHIRLAEARLDIIEMSNGSKEE